MIYWGCKVVFPWGCRPIITKDSPFVRKHITNDLHTHDTACSTVFILIMAQLVHVG